MKLELENTNNLIVDDLDLRNRNWGAIDTTFGLKADKTYVDNQDAALTTQLAETEQEIMSFKEDYTNLEGVNDGVLNPMKTAFFKTGRNMFDKSKAIGDTAVNQNTGVLYAAATNTASDYIPVNELTKYNLSGGNIRIAYYRADKSFISGVMHPVLPITTPVGAKYVRYSFNTSSIHVAIFNVGETVLPFEPYKEIIPQQYLDINILLLDKIKGTKQKPYFTNGVITKLEHINISDRRVVRTDNLNFSIANKIVETRVDAYSNMITLTTDLTTFETEVI